MIKIWGRRNSFNVQKVLWLADELGIVYDHIPAGGNFGRLEETGFRTLNPNGLVPVLEDGGLAIWESHAILRYLAAQYGTPQFWPSDPASASLMLSTINSRLEEAPDVRGPRCKRLATDA